MAIEISTSFNFYFISHELLFDILDVVNIYYYLEKNLYCNHIINIVEG